MQPAPDLPPCELKIPDSPHQRLSISQSLTLATFLLACLRGFIYFGSVVLFFSFFLIFYLFADDSSLVIRNIFPVFVFYFVYKVGISIVFYRGRSRLVSKFQQIIQRCEQIARKEIKVSLTSQTLVLNADNFRDPLNIEQAFNWRQVELITEDETIFRLQLPGLPELLLPKENLPAKWQLALQNSTDVEKPDRPLGENA
ncbi:hypothetical protein [uncultured Gimesia sp.]|jgi:hypothetical protein|uniref:hypothetical protein n=1 Tax=uncultured Gimesia sp. TaxID=1678688 RepID=UPI0026185332|nr:hypothetical protein [uncultured Gimesia sp.]